MYVKKLQKQNQKKKVDADFPRQEDCLSLDETRGIWISSEFAEGSCDIGFGVFSKTEEASFIASSEELEDQNLLTLKDIPKIRDILKVSA